MIYFSPKFILFGLSGVGVTAGGIATWYLTKNKKVDWSTAQQEVLQICGEYAWYNDNSRSFGQSTNKNSKSKTLEERNRCETEILEKYDLNPPSQKKK